MKLMEKLRQQLKANESAAASVIGGVNQFREELDQLNAERKRVEAMPVLRGEAEANLDRELDRRFAEALRNVQVGSLTRPNTPAMPQMSPETVDGLLIGANREGIRKVLIAEIAKRYEDGDGIGAADRAAKLAEIDAKIEEIEKAEELTIRRAEAAGLEILRRGDASPDALLMTDAALGA